MWVLIIGTVVSVALAFGPLWLVRAGIGVSLAMAFLTAFLAWREIDRIGQAHRVELKAMLKANTDQANRHHRDSLEMIDRFDTRARQLTAAIGRINAQLAAAHAELATMRGNSVWLRAEVAERQSRIDALEAQVAELEAARTQADGNLLSLPRYGVAAGRELLPSAEDLWADGNHPTVVDLAMLAFPEVLDERKQA